MKLKIRDRTIDRSKDIELTKFHNPRNLFNNPSFEEGNAQWKPMGKIGYFFSEKNSHSGNYAAEITPNTVDGLYQGFYFGASGLSNVDFSLSSWYFSGDDEAASVFPSIHVTIKYLDGSWFSSEVMDFSSSNRNVWIHNCSIIKTEKKSILWISVYLLAINSTLLLPTPTVIFDDVEIIPYFQDQNQKQESNMYGTECKVFAAKSTFFEQHSSRKNYRTPSNALKKNKDNDHQKKDKDNDQKKDKDEKENIDNSVEKEKKKDILTISTFVTCKMLPILLDVVRFWDGPISCSYYVYDDQFDLTELDKFVRSNSKIEQQVYFHLIFAERDSNVILPTNYLRNYASKYPVTKLVFQLDPDYSPCRNFSEIFREKYHGIVASLSEKTLFVIPAFEKTTSGSGSGFSDDVEIPETKKQLLDLIERGIYVPSNHNIYNSFNSFNSDSKDLNSQSSSNIEHWYTAEEMYIARYEDGYEPFVISTTYPKDNIWTPKFNPMFEEYEKSREQYIIQAEMAGYHFVVLPDLFVIRIRDPEYFRVHNLLSYTSKQIIKIHKTMLDFIRDSRILYNIPWGQYKELDNWEPLVKVETRNYLSSSSSSKYSIILIPLICIFCVFYRLSSFRNFKSKKSI